MPYQFSSDPRLEFSPVCRILIAVNVLVFLLISVVLFFGPGPTFQKQVYSLFGLFPSLLVREGVFWTPLTYMFLHANLLHLGINMMGLYLLGPDLEQVFGHWRFLSFYLISGLVGAACFLIISFVWQDQSLPVVGASGAIFGLLGGIVALFPLRTYIILPLMIPVKAYVLAVLLLTSHLFFILTPYGSNVAYDVHLGGGLAGFLMAGLAALRHHRRYEHLIPAPERPYATVELETLAYRMADGDEVSEADEHRYRQLREILRYEDIPSVEELRAVRRKS
jgi:membrane associated rhomboid family serine protease